METNEIALLIDIWALMKDLVPAGKREAIAEQYLSIFVDNGYAIEESIKEIGEDLYLNRAMIELFEIEEDSEDDE